MIIVFIIIDVAGSGLGSAYYMIVNANTEKVHPNQKYNDVKTGSI